MKRHPIGGHSARRDEIEGRVVTEGDQGVAVVVAAAQEAARSRLRALLDGAPGVAVVAEAGGTESALAAVSRHTPAVLVLDVDQPGDSSSLDTIRAVAQRSPATKVVVLVEHEDARFVRHALHAGAAGCVLGNAPDLVEAVRRAATREQATAHEPATRPDNLTERELEVLTLLALGHTNAEIGAQLHLSVRTVEAHRASLQRKLRRPSRAELVRYALDHGLLHPTADRVRG
jgi:two-component system, NarL family, response regulator NreC